MRGSAWLMHSSMYTIQRLHTQPSTYTLYIHSKMHFWYCWVTRQTMRTTHGGDRTWNDYYMTAKIAYKFSRESPYISNAFSRGSPKFPTGFHMRKRSPRDSKDLPENRVDLKIQIFQFWCPPRVVVGEYGVLECTRKDQASYGSSPPCSRTRYTARMNEWYLILLHICFELGLTHRSCRCTLTWPDVSRHSYGWVISRSAMGWLRSVGSIQL